MNHSDRQHSLPWGIFIIVLGGLFLIDNFGTFYARQYLPFWPTILLVAGTIKLMQAKHRGQFVFGAILMLLGVAAVFHHLGIFYFRMRDWWPMFLIGAGLMIVFNGKLGARRGKRRDEASTSPAANSPIASDSADAGIAAAPAGGGVSLEKSTPFASGADSETSTDSVVVQALWGGTRLRRDTQNFRGGELTAVMGGIQLDLRQASIQGEATLKIFAMWGGIVIRVPADWSVVLDCPPILGSSDDRTVPPIQASKRLLVNGTVIMGGFEVKN